MAIVSISVGPVEDAFQFDDTEFYSDGVTPKGLIVPVAPTTNNGVLRKIDLTGGGTISSGDQFVLANRIFGG